MPRQQLPSSAIKLISSSIDKLFDRLQQRVLGTRTWTGGKKLKIGFNPNYTLKALFEAATEEEGARPQKELLNPLLNVASSYLDAVKEKTKAKVIHGIQGFLHESYNKGVDTDVQTVLGGHLIDVWKEMSSDVKRILETESTIVRNTGTMDAITKTNALAGVEDPSIAFICVHDNVLCDECKRLHLMPDGITPRVWKMSELGSGYHKKGDTVPKLSGLHPNERCVLITVLPGFGFDLLGRTTYVSPGYDIYREQKK